MNKKNVYDFAASFLNDSESEEEAIRNAISYVIRDGNKRNIREILGEEAYIDYELGILKIRKWELEYFLDIFDMIAPEINTKISQDKIEVIREIFSSTNALNNINLAISEKIRIKNFPIQNLESTLIANGIGKYGSNNY